MAVLRASRLWVGPVYPEGYILDGEPVPRSQPLYNCPVGKRAIVRCATFTLPTPPTVDPNLWQISLWIRYGGGAYLTQVWWHWYRQTIGGTENLTYHAQFDGMIVVHGGEGLELSNVLGVVIHTQGSGMLLNDLS